MLFLIDIIDIIVIISIIIIIIIQYFPSALPRESAGRPAEDLLPLPRGTDVAVIGPGLWRDAARLGRVVGPSLHGEHDKTVR